MQLFKNAMRSNSRTSGPDFIIVGAQKAGTTALHLMLQDHPNLASATPKEVHYFDNDEWYKKGNTAAYHAHFPRPKLFSRTLTFEASPMYLYHPEVAARLKAYNPGIKLIALLREPASRAFSAWTMYHHHFKTGQHIGLHDPRSFEESIKDGLDKLHTRNIDQDKRAYVERGLYARQLERYFQHFSRDQMLVLENKDISERWDSTSSRLFDFLEIPKRVVQVKKALQSQLNESDKYTSAIQLLRDFYIPYNESLFKLIGRDFGWNQTKGSNT